MQLLAHGHHLGLGVATGKMHPDEVETDVALVSRLIAAQFPQWSRLAIEPVRSVGTDNALYRLGGSMVVRLPRRERTAATLEKERRWLPMLAPFLPVAIPVPLADGTPAEDFPFEWSVYSWVPGEDGTSERFNDKGLLATDLAAFIAALQGIDTTGGPPPGQHNFFRGVPLEQRDAQTRTAIESLRDAIDADAVTGAWEAALRKPAWQHPTRVDPRRSRFAKPAGRQWPAYRSYRLGWSRRGQPCLRRNGCVEGPSGRDPQCLPGSAFGRRVHLGACSRLGGLAGADRPFVLHP
jgi:hypothetical protein